jgi:hypothetical protein
MVCSCFAAVPNLVPEGTQLETTASASDVSLQNGVDLRLSARSASTIFHDHLVLDDGAVRVSHFNGYPVNVRELRIESLDSSTQAIVRLTKGTVEVASLGGGLNVTDGGVMLTRVVAGTRMSFQQNSAPAHKPLPSDQHTMLWVIGVTAVAALVIGLTAASQGKSI